jgi:predicted AAA+ superfamily ATPase
MYYKRELEAPLQEALKQFPVVLITGPRQAGKSTLLKHCLHGYKYVTLDDPRARAIAQTDPSIFLKTYEAPVIIDEIQYAPELLSYIKIEVDSDRRKYGQYVLTGSQVFSLMKGVSESLAGRIAIFQLYPLSWSELPNPEFKNEKKVVEQMQKGFYPEFAVQPNLNASYWHSSYLNTYIERDIRSIRNIQDLSVFQRFLVLIAARAGQLFNLNEIGKECGISQTTARDWLNLLESTSIVYLLEPYARNLTKRVIKSPKLFFIDTGLLCYLLRLETMEQLVLSPFAGHVFENMVVMEAVKQFAGRGKRAPCYFYRTSHGLEVDLLIDKGDKIDAFEIKFSSNPKIEMTEGLLQIKNDFPVDQAALLNLYSNPYPFSNGIIAEHWSRIIANEY